MQLAYMSHFTVRLVGSLHETCFSKTHFYTYFLSLLIKTLLLSLIFFSLVHSLTGEWPGGFLLTFVSKLLSVGRGNAKSK